MDNQDENKKTYHPIDQAFFAVWVTLGPELLVWACWYFNDAQLAQDLHDAAFEATVEGRRRWPTNISLKRHMKDAMRSILHDRTKCKSELALEYRNRVVNPKYERAPEDRDPSDWFEPPIGHPMRDVLHARTPEEMFEDAEGTAIAERMADEIFEMTTPGSIEHGILLEARKGNHTTADVAKALGKTNRQVQQAKLALRLTKVRPVLAQHGFTDPKQTKKAGKK